MGAEFCWKCFTQDMDFHKDNPTKTLLCWQLGRTGVFFLACRDESSAAGSIRSGSEGSPFHEWSWKFVHYFSHHRPFMHKETFQEVDEIKYPNWRMFLHVCSDFFVPNCWTLDSYRHAAACCTSGVTAWDFKLLSNELLWSHSFQFVLGMLAPEHAHPKTVIFWH